MRGGQGSTSRNEDIGDRGQPEYSHGSVEAEGVCGAQLEAFRGTVRSAVWLKWRQRNREREGKVARVAGSGAKELAVYPVSREGPLRSPGQGEMTSGDAA